MATQHAIEVPHNGATLRGMAYLPDGGVKRHPAVLLCHGFTGQRIEAGFIFVRIARALAAQGIAAVTFDFMHSGESDGSFDQMLVTGEVADAMRMTQWLQSQPFADRSRLGILGFSLGGLVAACVTGRTDTYKALALMAPTTVDNMCRHARGTETGNRITRGPYVLHPDFFGDLQTLDPLADVVKHPRPTLLVQGTADEAVTPAVADEFTQAMRKAAVPIDEHLIDGANHGFSKPEHATDVIETLAAWFQRQIASQ